MGPFGFACCSVTSPDADGIVPSFTATAMISIHASQPHCLKREAE